MTQPLLTVRDLVKEFAPRRGSLRRSAGTVHAVSGVSFDIGRGEALSIVGESGCGKSTTARCVTRLIEPTSGSIDFDGMQLTTLDHRKLREARRRFQIVFQDPHASLNPRQTVGDIIAEPLLVHGVPEVERRARVDELLDIVQLGTGAAERHPHQFSGGQRQRIGIARALALQPDLVVLDEPVSALDVSIQAEIIRLLQRLRDDFGLAYLFIAHDLSVVRHLSDRVAVMYLGKIVEMAAVADLYTSPAHPYTTALLSAAPIPDPLVERDRQRIVLAGDPPTPTNPPSGCRFRTRCWRADDTCAEFEPPLREIADGHTVACHHDLWAMPEAVSVSVQAR